MRKIHLLLTLLSAFIIFTSYVCTSNAEVLYSGTLDDTQTSNWTWTLDSDGVLTVYGTGDMPETAVSKWRFYRDTYNSADLSDNIQKIVISKGITSLTEYIFRDCHNLKEVEFPESLKTIPCGAFMNCGLEEITIPEGITRLEYSSFGNCENLRSVRLSSSVRIVASAFPGCKELSYIEVNGNLEFCDLFAATEECSPLTVKYTGNCTRTAALKDGIYAAYESVIKEIEIGPNVKTIGKGTVSSTDLDSIVIPDSVETIESGAFSNCSNLKTITFGRGIRNIEEGAFPDINNPDNNNIENVIFLPGITRIPNYCLSSFTNVKKVVIPEGVTEIGRQAFSSCYSLESISLPSTLKKIGYGAFSCCYVLKGVKLPNSITTIGQSAFSYCESLDEIVVPGSVKSIPKAAFSDAGIKRIVISEGTTRIESNAFRGCSKLSSITIPNTIEFIGHSAFRECGSLMSITLGRNVSTVQFGAFIESPTSVTWKKYPSTSIQKIVKGKKSLKVAIRRLKRSKLNMIDGYQIRYSSNRDMSGAKYVTVRKATTLNKTIKKLKSKKKYYVQVRTYDVVEYDKYYGHGKNYTQKFYSGWSSIKSAKTK